MSVHDDIECIGRIAKNEIILAWIAFIDFKISEQALLQKFHVETGYYKDLDTVEWYVRHWRGY